MRDGNRSGTLLVCALLVALLPRAAVAAGSVRVTLTPQRLTVGDTAQLTFEVSRAGLGSFRFAPPRFELENFQVVGGPSRQENMSWVNGKLSQSYGLTWYLSPQRPGKARVYALRLVSGDDELALPDQEAWVEEVGAAGAPGVDENGRGAGPGHPGTPFDAFGPLRDIFSRRRPSAATGPPQILLRADVSPARPWAGQQLLYTLYLLAERRAPGEGRVVIETIFPRRVPAFQGFWSQEVQLPENGRAEMVELDGKLWWRQAILQRALFAYEPGAHEVDAAEADLRIIYFRPVGFGFGEEPLRRAVRRQSNPVQLAVQALPPPPAGFGGAVGPLQARVRLDPPKVAAGEAAILTAEISGNGNLSGLPDPKLAPLPGLQISPPQESSRQKVEGTRLESTRSWSWTLVPERAGAWSLPALSWVTFDPAKGAYGTVSTAAEKLAATPAAPAPPAAARPTGAPAPAAAARSASWGGPLGWAVGGAGGALALAGLGLLLARLFGRDRAARRQLVAEVTAALGEPHPRQAAGAAEEAWRSFLGARYDLPVEAPPTHWAGLLAKRGLGPALAGELVRLVDDLHYLRYAPRLASTDSLQRELLERSRRLARRLR